MKVPFRRSLAITLFVLLGCWFVPAVSPVRAADEKASLQVLKGQTATDPGGTLTAEDAATLGIGPAPAGPYRFEAQVQLAERGKAAGDWRLTLADPKNPKAAPFAAMILNRDDEGYVLSFGRHNGSGQGLRQSGRRRYGKSALGDRRAQTRLLRLGGDAFG